MKNKTTVLFAIILVFALVFFAACTTKKPVCGNGVCEPPDENQNNCPIDKGGDCPQVPPQNGELLTINISQLEFSAQNTDLFKSSTRFRPTSNNSGTIYLTEFQDHETSRVTEGSWSLRNSSCLLESECPNSLVKMLNDNSIVKVDAFRTKNKKIIIDFWGTPKWLSSSSDETKIDETTYEYQLHPPKDYAKWNAAIKKITEYYSQFKDVEFYFEIWNEPDLKNFWRGDTDQYLELYGETAKAIKEANPGIKVGGAVPNKWDGKIGSDPKLLNIELIKYAAKNNLPLDFISWHHYNTGLAAQKAVDAYKKALSEAGYAKTPEFVISEWNAPTSQARNSGYAPILMADNMLAFYKNGINVQTVYAWQDDSASEQDSRYYGLITQAEKARPVLYMHKMFDDLSRDTLGVALNQDQNIAWIISKTSQGGCYKIILGKWDEGNSSKETPYTLAISDAKKLVNAEAASVKDSYNEKTLTTSGNSVSFGLRGNEMMGIKFCVKS
ncbi:MAG: hypothetical protein AABW99_03195 [archaeon]